MDLAGSMVPKTEAASATASEQPARRPLTEHRADLPALTGVRFLAAMYVVLYHSKLPDQLAKWGLHASSLFVLNGKLAVLLFFILSGFILSYTYEGQIGTRSKNRRFWEARFARIWPLYAFSLVASSVANHTTPSLPNAVATLLMVQSWNPVNAGMAASWNFVCWTLSTEALFYLLFPFVQPWLERSSVQWQSMCLAVSLGIGIALSTGSINYADMHGFQHVPLALLHVPDFLIGMCSGNLFLRRRSAFRLLAPQQPFVPGRGLWTWTAAIVSIFLLAHSTQRVVSWTEASFAALLIGLAAERTLIQRVLSSELLKTGGKVSYGIYLLQWPCKAVINTGCDALHIGSMAARFVLDCVALILLSAGTFYGIEEPARRWIRSQFARREAKAVRV